MDLFGGAERDRTADLLNAIQALSQLSYGPTMAGMVTSQAKRKERRRKSQTSEKAVTSVA